MDYKNAGVDIEAGSQISGIDEKTCAGDHEKRSIDKSWRFLRCVFNGSI